ncbi:MFS general substrate transporter [Aspergillus costaricaensis CBS 115574]|uniref:MFS general substrate transporter n=1 Tax=Aspergillus costaricaensis CBS 115574 TaxID=1448317 RepID=A0ACD1IK35_9EURO|nr:MFS general substrate transporter [Aspergillus costaricaensis CBS 115574]RAK90677.1 MFS general substrate transporter [Aspergillus costaricaensis CBS 115574]
MNLPEREMVQYDSADPAARPSSTPPRTVASDIAAAANQTEIDWEGDADPSNPMNWSSWYRWCHIVVISLLTFVTSLGSSMLAPAVPDVMRSLGSDNAELESFVVSIYVIGFALGPLIAAPMSEIYGRSIVYHLSNVLFLGATIGCALSTNVGMFLAFRLISGCAGVTPLALGGGSIGDLMAPEKMGTAMAIWGLGSLVAPVFAPIAGGYLSEDVGWRWIFWVITIPMAVLTLLSLVILRETYAPILLERKARRLRRATGNQDIRPRSASMMSQRQVFFDALVRPLKMLLTSPVVMTLAFDVAVVYGYQYLVFTTLSYIFQDVYHLSTGLSGLVYLGDGIGTILGIFSIGYASDKVAERRKARLGTPDETLPPESWLWPMVPASLLTPIGLLWYGWSLQTGVFPVVPLVGLGVFGFGMMGIFQPVQIYLVNAFPVHSASALAASNLLRSLVGALLPLGGERMYDAMGLGWGNSLLAFIALAMAPVPYILMRFGERMRMRDRNINK